MMNHSKPLIAQYAHLQDAVKESVYLGDCFDRSIGAKIKSELFDINCDFTYPSRSSPWENHFELQIRYANKKQEFEGVGRVKLHKSNVEFCTCFIRAPNATDTDNYNTYLEPSAINPKRFVSQLHGVIDSILSTDAEEFEAVRLGLSKLPLDEITVEAFPTVSIEESKKRLAPFGKDIQAYFI